MPFGHDHDQSDPLHEHFTPNSQPAEKLILESLVSRQYPNVPKLETRKSKRPANSLDTVDVSSLLSIVPKTGSTAPNSTNALHRQLHRVPSDKLVTDIKRSFFISI